MIERRTFQNHPFFRGIKRGFGDDGLEVALRRRNWNWPARLGIIMKGQGRRVALSVCIPPDARKNDQVQRN
jgi:hypothetical protein